MSENETVKAVWVVGRYKGRVAEKIMAHAGEGAGYYDLENLGSKTNPDILVCFRTVLGVEPLPEQLTEIIDKYKIERLEKKRNHQPVRGQPIKKASAEAVKRAKEIFEAAK